MDNSFFSFTKADRKVIVWLLVIGLAVASVLVFCFPAEDENEQQKIERPEHWWEER